MPIWSMIDDLLDWVYPDLPEHYSDRAWLMSRGVLCCRNETTDAGNRAKADRIGWAPVNETSSYDRVPADDNASLYPTDFLNSLCPSGMPPHKLYLKLGMPVMLLRNLNPLYGDCNGTQYIVKAVSQRCVTLETSNSDHGTRTMLCPLVTLQCSAPPPSPLPLSISSLSPFPLMFGRGFLLFSNVDSSLYLHVSP